MIADAFVHQSTGALAHRKNRTAKDRCTGAPTGGEIRRARVLQAAPRAGVRRCSGFTLIELLVAVSISMTIMGAVFFSLSAALESWHYARDELALQQVMSGLLEEIQEGDGIHPGLRAALELTEASEGRLGFVPPWVEAHAALGGPEETFRLTQHVKPGAGLPATETRLPDTNVFRPVPVSWAEPDNLKDKPLLKAGFELIPGSTVYFSYHPDPQRAPQVVVSVGWDPVEKSLYWETVEGREPMGENLFGVEVVDCRFRYFDPANNPLVEGGDVRWEDLPLITAVEMEMTGRLGSHSLTLLGLVMLRNSMRHSGLVVLRERLKVPIPNSKEIQTFVLTNLTGVEHDDRIELEVRPPSGRAWRVKIRFEQYGDAKPVIADVTVEYPPGHPVLTDHPGFRIDPGLDLLTLGPNGLYDYDDDEEVDDVVLVDGDSAELTVTKMDIQGAACFIQP